MCSGRAKEDAVNIQIIDPLSDDRWDHLVARHPRASVFHQRGWLQALGRTYGYKPFVLTSAPMDKPLQDGLVFCRVSSWITGTRLVSLPFSDHCEPLLEDAGDSEEFMAYLRGQCDRNHWKYVEIRPSFEVETADRGLPNSSSYWFHELDITPDLEQLFAGLHRSSFQGKIRKARRQGLSYEVGLSQQLVNEFYQLLLNTRKRHGLPPQPRKWFKHLVEGMGDNIQIRLARKDGVSIAAVLTLRHGPSIVYKYACSDARFHNLGGMPFLIWQLIKESKASGAQRVDFGRSDLDNQGLISFKDRTGAIRRPLTYRRYGSGKESNAGMRWKPLRLWSFSKLPNAALSVAGSVIYKHMG
jgi:CelD/BcsL family acetyltransferase involved in cellulose biosynthesis